MKIGITSTTNSIMVKVHRPIKGIFRYSIGKHPTEVGDSTVYDTTYEGEELTHLFEGLETGTYDVKVEMLDAEKETIIKEGIKTLEVGKPEAYIKEGTLDWINGRVTIIVEGVQDEERIEWVLDNPESTTWNPVTITEENKEISITGIKNNTKIYVRKVDKINNYSKENAVITIQDTIAPSKFNINVTDLTNTGITITREDSSDQESGIQKYEFYIGNRKIYEGLDKSFIVNDLEQGTLYNDIYVVVYDNAGNKTECNERKSIKTYKIVHEWKKYSANITTQYVMKKEFSREIESHTENRI